jgi:RimJ/RimL family protein N-acetyltransferase
MDIDNIKKDNISLEGKYIKLQILNPENDYEELYDISHRDNEKERVWIWMNVDEYKKPFNNKLDFKKYLMHQLNNHDCIPFTVIDKKSNKKIGQITYINIVKYHKRIEIGHVWYGIEYHGSFVNIESVLLMLYNAFENLKYRRIEWKTNSNNIASQKAAKKLGFTYEGTFRQHMFANNINRDTVWYSMLDIEWNEKKEMLMDKLKYTENDKNQLFINKN